MTQPAPSPGAESNLLLTLPFWVTWLGPRCHQGQHLHALRGSVQPISLIAHYITVVPSRRSGSIKPHFATSISCISPSSHQQLVFPHIPVGLACTRRSEPEKCYGFPLAPSSLRRGFRRSMQDCPTVVSSHARGYATPHLSLVYFSRRIA